MRRRYGRGRWWMGGGGARGGGVAGKRRCRGRENREEVERRIKEGRGDG